jgi:hypothetical protein
VKVLNKLGEKDEAREAALKLRDDPRNMEQKETLSLLSSI